MMIGIRASSFSLLLASTFLGNAGGITQSIDMGTTLVAVKHREGVVVAADSRTSVSGYVSHRSAHKITPVTSHCVILRSGSAADTQQIARVAKWNFMLRSSRFGLVPTVSQIAHWIRSIVYNESGSFSLIIAGCDEVDGSPHIFTIAPSGALLEESNFAASGSGSTFIIGHLDQCLSGDPASLDETTAVQICKDAVNLAINRDGSSGGSIQMMIITADGTRSLTFISSNDYSYKIRPTPLIKGFAIRDSP